MTQEIEIEFKNMLTRAEFIQLLHHFNISEYAFFVQENEYFDTASFNLRKQHSALRIRRKGQQYILTLKQPADEGILETHQSLTLEEVEAFKDVQYLPYGDVHSVLEQIGVEPEALCSLGTLTTRRAELPYEKGLLVFDHSLYLGTEDFELEYEAQSFKIGANVFHHLLSGLHIPERPTKNKIVRFYDKKENL